MDGRALVRLAQLRGRVAALARGGRFDLTAPLLGQLVRADLALGMTADGLLRARQAAHLAEDRGEPLAGPLVVLAASLLAAGELDGACDAAEAATDAANDVGADAARPAALAALVGGAAHRRAGRLAEARVRLDRARRAGAVIGGRLVGLALAELGHVDLAEDHPAGAAVCFRFAAESLARAGDASAAAEAGVLEVTSRLRGGELDAATTLAGHAADAARAAGRPELVAYLDGELADAALAPGADPAAASQASALAAESAEGLPDGELARELRAEARLRQARASTDELDRARHLEVGIGLAGRLPAARAGVVLVRHLVALAATMATRADVEPVRAAIAALGDRDLGELAAGIAQAATSGTVPAW